MHAFREVWTSISRSAFRASSRIRSMSSCYRQGVFIYVMHPLRSPIHSWNASNVGQVFLGSNSIRPQQNWMQHQHQITEESSTFDGKISSEGNMIWRYGGTVDVCELQRINLIGCCMICLIKRAKWCRDPFVATNITFYLNVMRKDLNGKPGCKKGLI